jgi:uncharacterized protein (TIGR03118 family)
LLGAGTGAGGSEEGIMKSTRIVLLALAVAGAGCGGQAATNPQVDDGEDTQAQPMMDGSHHHIGRKARVVDETDLISNVKGAALVTDPTLVNAWGLAFNPSGIAWISANGSGISNVYNAQGAQVIPSVTIPSPQGGNAMSAPTGQVFNDDPDLFMGDRFIFVTEDGTVAGWQPGFNDMAKMRIDRSGSGAVYKGATITTDFRGNTRVYAANFNAGTIDVWDSDYDRVETRGRFHDRMIPSGYAPFNIQNVEGLLVVTYAKQDDAKHDDVKGAGNGFVDLYSPNGFLLARLIANGALNSPWGVALEPDSLSSNSRRLLIGNFGDGMINVYRVDGDWRSATIEHEGALVDRGRDPIVIDGLWALRFGPGAGGFGDTQLFFTAGPDDEKNGLFGRLDFASIDRRHHH